MFHRFFLRRLVFFLLIGGLLFGGARALFGAGYRQGFVQGSLLAAGDGQAVTVAPEAAFRAMTHWGLGPMEAMFCGLPLALLALGVLAFLFASGARRHHAGGPPWGQGMGRGFHHPHGGHGHGPSRPDDIGPEKQPYV
ncbi:MAG: hypothetical protein IPH95_11210 [Candidatus Promineofilum sp.]|jgi:hypothetical protein|nr:hypothetical protein [Promineifilum sp.]